MHEVTSQSTGRTSIVEPITIRKDEVILRQIIITKSPFVYHMKNEGKLKRVCDEKNT